MKKIIIGLLVIAIIIIGLFTLGGLDLGGLNNQNEIDFGNTKFYLPNGFQESGVIESGDINASNGYESIYFHKYNDTELTEHVNAYVNERKADNFTPILTNFTVNDTLVYKTVIVNQTHSMHYWFIKDGTVFSVYTWDGIPKMDQIVSDLVVS